MKKIFFVTCAVVSMTLIMAGCATSPIPQGYIANSTKVPMGLSNASKGTKVGKATAVSWFSLVASGDASIEAASKEGDIQTISHVDHQIDTEIPLGIKTVYTTLVYGN